MTKSFNLPEDHVLNVFFFGTRGGSGISRYLDKASATVQVSDESIASAVIDGDNVIVTPKALGNVTVTVTADADPSDARAYVSGSFGVTIAAAQAEVVEFGEGFAALPLPPVTPEVEPTPA
jgi:hypothetical protein